MKYFSIALIIVFMGVSSIRALSCYDCVYVESEAPKDEDHDVRCKETNEKDTDLSAICEDLDYIPHFRDSSIMIAVPNHLRSKQTEGRISNATRVQGDESSVYSCLTVKMDGKMVEDGVKYPTIAIYRYCILLRYTNSSLPTKCYRSTNAEIMSKMEEEDLKMDMNLFYYGIMFSNETSTEVCCCSTDYCNGENTSNNATTILPDSATGGSLSLLDNVHVYFITVLVCWFFI